MEHISFQIIMTNTSKPEEVCFKCDKWLSEDKEDGEVTREFPALVDGEPIYPGEFL